MNTDMNTDMNNDMNQQSPISMNILIVEDDAIQRSGLNHIIAEHYPAFSVFTASCFNEATAIIDSSKFDLFMLDTLEMAKVDLTCVPISGANLSTKTLLSYL